MTSLCQIDIWFRLITQLLVNWNALEQQESDLPGNMESHKMWEPE